MLLSTKYSGPLNNTGLNCLHSIIRGFFQIIHTMAPHGPWVVESVDAEHRIQRTYCKVTLRISTARKWAPQPLSCSSVNYSVSSECKFRQVHLAAAAAKSLHSCPTLCDPIDSSPPGSPVPGILQARTLEWARCILLSSNHWPKQLSTGQLISSTSH